MGMVFKHLEIPSVRKGAITRLPWVFNRITELSDGMIGVKTTFKVGTSTFRKGYFLSSSLYPILPTRRLSEEISAIESYRVCFFRYAETSQSFYELLCHLLIRILFMHIFLASTPKHGSGQCLVFWTICNPLFNLLQLLTLI